jgi:acetyl esterase/lipase
MPEQSSPHGRRPELEQAYQHLMTLASTADLTGITAPRAQWLAQVRTTVPGYCGVGPQIDYDGVTITPVSADGVPAEWVTAEGADGRRRIVYFHGGAWAAGSPMSHRPISATLARLSGASILMVDYRLAPEHRFPAGLEDCVAAYNWALTNGPDSAATGRAGLDEPERICIAGDSAGGNLSAATCVRLAATGGRMPDRLALIAGTLDQISMWDRIGIDDLICVWEALQYSVDHYLRPGQSPANPEVSPVFAPESLLEKFPPTLLQVGSLEALAFDSKQFAARLEKARVRVSLSLWPDVPHVWHGMLGLFPEAKQALGEIADFVNR